MNRRTFLGSALALAGGSTIASRVGAAAIPKMKVRRIRYYRPQHVNPTFEFNQSNCIVTVETDSGITRIGEGGSKDMMDQCASMLIGEDPSRWGMGKTCPRRIIAPNHRGRALNVATSWRKIRFPLVRPLPQKAEKRCARKRALAG